MIRRFWREMFKTLRKHGLMEADTVNEFRQHIPNFVDAPRPEPVAFETQDELLAIPAVASWAEDPKFSHFALSENHLMAILDGGFHWWVVGYLRSRDGLSLPEWDHGKSRAILDGKEVAIPGTDVASYCGDEIRLRDGRTARKLR